MADRYGRQDIIRILKSDIETPEVVTAQMNRAFRQIGTEPEKKAVRRKKRGLRWQIAVAVMEAMMLGTVTVGAAGFILWNPDVAERFEASEEQQKALEEQKVAVPAEAGASANGVTVSLEQYLATEKYMYLYFKITAPEDMKLTQETFFENSGLLINGEEMEANYSGGIPDLSEDGTDNVIYWEYFVQWVDKQKISGQEMTAHFDNLLERNEAEITKTLVEGTWDVTWNLEYEPSEETFAVNQPLEGTDITVKSITISPISLEVTYDLPRKMEQIEVIDENSNKITRNEYEEPDIYASQYRMKDGSVEDINAGGPDSEGYQNTDESDNTYVVSSGCTKVYTVEDIESIIFVNRETNQTYDVPLAAPAESE